MPAVSPANPMAANGAVVASLASTTTINNVLLGAELAQIGLPSGTQTVATGILTVAVQPISTVSGAPTPAASAQNQPGQPANGVLFSFTSTNLMQPGGLLSPGVSTGFTGRIVFANTGTPQRVANGAGEFSPAGGVVPTGLYLTGGGGEAPPFQPARPAPSPAPLPLPGVFFQPGAGVDGLYANPDAKAIDEAMASFPQPP
jgi:hypothetical protein